MKPKLLFVDDRWNRIQQAIETYKDYDVVIAPNVKEALRQLVAESFAVVSLDCDLNGEDFQDPEAKDCGLEIVHYIQKTGWPNQRPMPEFWIHSTNLFAANRMAEEIERSYFGGTKPIVVKRPFGWKRYQHGVVAGAFDVIHPGYIYLLREAKELCHKVTVLLHDKPNQVFDLETRTTVLLGLKYVDDVIPYESEQGLDELLLKLKPDVRIVGSDHKGKSSRQELGIKTIYHDREHLWSATRYKNMIAEKVSHADSL